MAIKPWQEQRDDKIRHRYRYPDECCMNCKNSYENTYGDFQCKELKPGNTIEKGAVCDSYVHDDYYEQQIETIEGVESGIEEICD